MLNVSPRKISKIGYLHSTNRGICYVYYLAETEQENGIAGEKSLSCVRIISASKSLGLHPKKPTTGQLPSTEFIDIWAASGTANSSSLNGSVAIICGLKAALPPPSLTREGQSIDVFGESIPGSHRVRQFPRLQL